MTSLMFLRSQSDEKTQESPWLPGGSRLQMVDVPHGNSRAGGIEPIVYPASMPKWEVWDVEGHPRVVLKKNNCAP